MKRLLLMLPLLLAPAQAGNLGAADEVMFGVNKLAPASPSPKKTPDYSQTKFEVQPGRPWVRHLWPMAVASFSDGLFKIVTPSKGVEKLQRKGRVDPEVVLDESGINSGQVISFDYHVHSPNIAYSLLYRDSDRDVQLTSCFFEWREDKAQAFKKAFLNWMSTDAAAQRR